jgi:hypothetical protein
MLPIGRWYAMDLRTCMTHQGVRWALCSHETDGLPTRLLWVDGLTGDRMMLMIRVLWRLMMMMIRDGVLWFRSERDGHHERRVGGHLHAATQRAGRLDGTVLPGGTGTGRVT